MFGINNCSECGGTGYKWMPCKTCYGQGWREQLDDEGRWVRRDCPDCNGERGRHVECECRRM